eukprot:CAMPEP_0196184188 /NCGR_PEP_ID=MMETSP0911-20130528/33369_1 /TAXON_ID=49265 /ORGANISM="Thalassiosira rotula, Strain GSO102" /LENGTH=50 /DNA_ID=CAMNT_0041454305 /DNA_START=177 /DNA_END=329 /DNA_ORIENTATION=+
MDETDTFHPAISKPTGIRWALKSEPAIHQHSSDVCAESDDSSALFPDAQA